MKSVIFWILRLVAAVIMLQTLFFKFTAAEESVYIFSTLGIEPWGRIGTGVIELIASVLLLIPSTTAFGALLGVGVMSGALMSHLTKLGIVVQGDQAGTTVAFTTYILAGSFLIRQLGERQIILNWVLGIVLLITGLVQLYKTLKHYRFY